MARSPPLDESVGRTTVVDPATTSPMAGSPGGDAPGSVARYVLEERLGEGGGGVVWRGQDPVLGREVAIKLVRAEASAGEDVEAASMRLLREAQALAQLNHPNVVVVHDVGRVEGGRTPGVFIVMELVDGPNLRQWLQQNEPSPHEILRSYVAAGRGLVAAHECGLVHRDFKPDNVIMGLDGRVRVVDFGLARAVAPQGGEVSNLSVDVTENESVIGTPRYMSPEQHRGEMGDARADQFAFCVSLYEALVGVHPFVGRTASALASAKSSGEIQRPAAELPVSDTLVRALTRGLHADPERRYPSVDALLDALVAEAQSLVVDDATAEAITPLGLRLKDVLTVVLGPQMARRALSLACARAGKRLGKLDAGDAVVVARTVGPVIKTLAGKQVADRVISEILEEPRP